MKRKHRVTINSRLMARKKSEWMLYREDGSLLERGLVSKYHAKERARFHELSEYIIKEWKP